MLDFGDLTRTGISNEVMAAAPQHILSGHLKKAKKIEFFAVLFFFVKKLFSGNFQHILSGHFKTAEKIEFFAVLYFFVKKN